MNDIDNTENPLGAPRADDNVERKCAESEWLAAAPLALASALAAVPQPASASAATAPMPAPVNERRAALREMLITFISSYLARRCSIRFRCAASAFRTALSPRQLR